MHVETEWSAALALEVPVRVVCDLCGEARALSTTTAVVVAGADWVEQTEDFRQGHRCDKVDRGRA